ncbi:hypothetical protein Tco_0839457 [Tanacetum coccineum]|uniref:Uncharacterized protein n=1 Tax=Tanacetum coccineum TaxID=301880 RepID=A0ABQ5ARB9_9ASTR
MSNVAVETQESVVMLPEIASSMARLATSSKMARRTLRQVHLVTLTRKPDTSSRVFAITQNQTTNISEELPGISSIRDKELLWIRRKLRLSLNGQDRRLRPKHAAFWGLAGHYHGVVEVFSLLALPLTKLTRKDEKLYGSKSERRSLKNDIPAEDRATTRSHEYHSFHVISYPHDQIREDLSHLNEPEAILNCQDRIMMFRPNSPERVWVLYNYVSELRLPTCTGSKTDLEELVDIRMVTPRYDAELATAVQAAVDVMLP